MNGHGHWTVQDLGLQPYHDPHETFNFTAISEPEDNRPTCTRWWFEDLKSRDSPKHPEIDLRMFLTPEQREYLEMPDPEPRHPPQETPWKGKEPSKDTQGGGGAEERAVGGHSADTDRESTTKRTPTPAFATHGLTRQERSMLVWSEFLRVNTKYLSPRSDGQYQLTVSTPCYDVPYP